MFGLRNIVVGTDHSACADHAMETAVRLAAAANARITLVHVCTLDAEPWPDDALLQACREALARTSARFAHASVEVAPVLRAGRPAEKLNNVAVEVGARLIIIGRDGRGRVSECLLRTALRPVLVIPYNDAIPGRALARP